MLGAVLGAGIRRIDVLAEDVVTFEIMDEVREPAGARWSDGGGHDVAALEHLALVGDADPSAALEGGDAHRAVRLELGDAQAVPAAVDLEVDDGHVLVGEHHVQR